MNMDRLVSLIAVFMALILAWRGLRSYQLDKRRTWMIAVAWVVIFVALMLSIRVFLSEA